MSRVETTHDLTTLQGVFDHVAENLLKQGRRSTNGEVCMYRDPDGCKCAAGWLMPDESYHEDLEGNILTAYDADPDDARVHVSTSILAAFDERIPHTYEMREHIHELQKIHDRPQGRLEDDSSDEWQEAWLRAMAYYGKHKHLSTAILGSVG